MSKKGRWIKGSWTSLRDERTAPDELLYITEVEQLVGRDRRSILRWGLEPVRKEGRWNLYSRREALELAAAKSATVKRKPTRAALRESHAVMLYRHRHSIDQVAQKVDLPTSYAVEIHEWWQMATQLVTFRQEAVEQANLVLECATTRELRLHLGLHVPTGPGLFPLMSWALELASSASRVTRAREKLEKKAGGPLFEDPAELERWLASVEEGRPNSPRRASQPALRLDLEDDEANGGELSTLVTATRAAQMLGVSARQLRRISQWPNTPLPKRKRSGSWVFYARADVIAFLFRHRILSASPDSKAAEAAALFESGAGVDGALVQLQLSCDEALRLYADWAEFHVACVEGHLMQSLVAAFRRSRLEVPDGLLDSSRTVRDDALVSLARSVVRLDRAAAELHLQEARFNPSGEGSS